MILFNLNGKWQLKYRRQSASGGQWHEIEGEVPGNVELDLMRAGIVGDLTLGDNVYQALALEQNEWQYVKTFRLTGPVPAGKVMLVFEGIDCLATVKLNGHEVGHAANMLISHCFDVTKELDPAAENLLEVHIRPAVPAGQAFELSPDTYAQPNSWESLRIRKAGHMYGWDIAPRIVSAGLWRGVRLEVEPVTRFRSVYLATAEVDADHRTATLLLDWDIASQASIHALTLTVKILNAGCIVYESQQPLLGAHGRMFINLTNVDLWWPRGFGRAQLYDAVIELSDAAGKVLAEYRQKLGIRTVSLRRTELTSDRHDGDFSFIVNGRRIYVKGTNWVPLDALHSRDRQHLDKTFTLALELNCNMLRCWGGNVYEDHDFFDLCDQHGVMVWQDFALACAIYPQDEEFAGQIRAEAESAVTKLRRHPSLVLWSGNNEIDSAYTEWTPFKRDPNRCDKLSRKVLAEVIAKLDPLREYLPSSPCYGPMLMAAGIPHDRKPEDHLWGPRDDFKGQYYLSSNAHFVSEIGYHGCPDMQTMRQMLDPEMLWPWQNNSQWLTKAVRPLPEQTQYHHRIPLMANQITVLFDRAPDNLPDFILASQISQAEAMKFFIEKWRSEREFRSGMLWWNLRDCWPVISDAVVDYYYRKKLAFDYIKTSQTDVVAIITEAQKGIHQLLVVNDSADPVAGNIAVKNVDGEYLWEGAFEVTGNDKTVLTVLQAADCPVLWLTDMTLVGDTKVWRNHYLAGPRPFQLETYKKWLRSIPHGENDVFIR